MLKISELFSSIFKIIIIMIVTSKIYN